MFKCLIINIIILITHVSISKAQSFDYKNLKNTIWKYDLKNDSLKIDKEVVYYLEDSIYYFFHINKTKVPYDTMIVSAGIWQINNDKLLIFYEHSYGAKIKSRNEIEQLIWFKNYNRCELYKFLSDTNDSLKLVYFKDINHILKFSKLIELQYKKYDFYEMDNENKYNLLVDYNKLPKRNLFIGNQDSKRGLLLKNNMLIGIEKKSNPNTYFYGNYFTCDSNHVYFSPERQTTYNYDNNYSITNTIEFYKNTDTLNYPWIKYMNIEKITFNDIQIIKHHKNNKINFISSILLASSASFALVIAPLVSYNFKTGNFNQKTYYKVMIPSLITLGVSMPLTIFTSNLGYYKFNASKQALVFKPR